MASKFFADGYAAYGMPESALGAKHVMDFSAAVETPQLESSLEQRLALLNIPYNEATRSVRKAIAALYEHTEQLQFELESARERLHDAEALAQTDAITAVANRRAFFQKLEWAIAMHERYQHTFSLVYFDLNNLKIINDRYGHAAGDMAIRHAARILKETMRETDFLARIGGDEFAIIMHYADEEAALRRGRRIAQQMHASSFMFNGQSLSISTACGVYSIQPGDDPDTALHNADRAMYADKASFKAYTSESFQA